MLDAIPLLLQRRTAYSRGGEASNRHADHPPILHRIMRHRNTPMHSQPAMQTATKARQPYVCALSALAAAALFCMGTAHAAERTVTPAQQAQAVTAAQAGIPET
ncbi:uncharacterized protein METZ01_LOCUS386478, partial [marine metagenome]